MSLNRLVQETLLSAVLKAEEQERFEEYTLLGEDRDGCNVDYAVVAQSEAVLNDEL